VDLIVTTRGTVHCIYDESIDLSTLGAMLITRASHVEPDTCGGSRWCADMSPLGGPILGPFALRSDALHAERQWLESRLAQLTETVVTKPARPLHAARLPRRATSVASDRPCPPARCGTRPA